ncbi:MAG: 2-oxoacid:ferredoxin oxidoreductase subunit beta [Candidatus Helarchaeota archaeon]|nr:2-oxoacid:ferredoxin oxidoreductase subunit beta [Candidatus Helarchaeota archaeon]
MSLPPYSAETPKHPYELVSFTGRNFGFAFHLFCRGCGYGAIGQHMNRVFKDENLDETKYPFIVGVGCYSIMPLILPGRIWMTLHGRTLAVATGIKLANPDVTPICLAGDGDNLALGTNHFVHACRRNIGIVLIMLHNNTYGMTGGQSAPTTPIGMNATTAPYGFLEEEFDAVQLAITAGATFVARWTTAHPRQFIKSVKKAVKWKGFSFIDMVSQCPTYFGRKNDMAEPVDVFNWIKGNSITIEKAKGVAEEDLKGKFVVGEFKESPRKELSEKYIELIERARRKKK